MIFGMHVIIVLCTTAKMISPILLLFSFRSCTAQKTLNASYATATSFPVSTLFLPRGRKREDPGNEDPLLVPSVHSLLPSREEERGLWEWGLFTIIY